MEAGSHSYQVFKCVLFFFCRFFLWQINFNVEPSQEKLQELKMVKGSEVNVCVWGRQRAELSGVCCRQWALCSGPAVILPVRIRRPTLIPGSWPSLLAVSAAPCSPRPPRVSRASGSLPARWFFFRRPGLCADGSAANWLRSQNVDFVTQPAFQKRAKDLLNVQ